MSRREASSRSSRYRSTITRTLIYRIAVICLEDCKRRNVDTTMLRVRFYLPTMASKHSIQARCTGKIGNANRQHRPASSETRLGSVESVRTRRLRDIVYRCVVLVEGRKKRKNATARDDIADVVYAAKDVLGVKLLADDNATDLTKIGRVGAADALEQSARYLTNAHDSINSLFKSMFGHEVVRQRDVFQSFEKVDNVAGSARPKPRPMANLGRGQGGKQLATIKRNEAQTLPRKRKRSSSASTSRTSKRRASRRTSTVEETIASLAYVAPAASIPRITPIVVEETNPEMSASSSSQQAPTPTTPTDSRIIGGEFIR